MLNFVPTGQTGYAIVPMIARGIMLGPDQRVIRYMLDIQYAAAALNGVKMELIDSAFPLLKGFPLDLSAKCRFIIIRFIMTMVSSFCVHG